MPRVPRPERPLWFTSVNTGLVGTICQHADSSWGSSPLLSCRHTSSCLPGTVCPYPVLRFSMCKPVPLVASVLAGSTTFHPGAPSTTQDVPPSCPVTIPAPPAFPILLTLPHTPTHHQWAFLSPQTWGLSLPFLQASPHSTEGWFVHQNLHCTTGSCRQGLLRPRPQHNLRHTGSTWRVLQRERRVQEPRSVG